MFHGSYCPSDVIMLLKPIDHPFLINVSEKEALIQSREKHYSEMISPETLPSARYMDLFLRAWSDNWDRLSRDMLTLAGLISNQKQGQITLVSLARAGTPVGVILKRLLENVFGRDVVHYSVSIIRDRGIDEVAMDYILADGRSPESIVFIDGWTGKGVISRELKYAIGLFNERRGVQIDASLWVLADLAGVAGHSATSQDYLIPSSILNSTVSGLISRSILNDQIKPGDFHGCYYYAQFKVNDYSREFVDAIARRAIEIGSSNDNQKQINNQMVNNQDALHRKSCVEQLIKSIMREFGVNHINHVKPGIGEATRVLLRREPELILLSKKRNHRDIEHIMVLAEEKGVEIKEMADLGPYQAIAIIKERNHA